MVICSLLGHSFYDPIQYRERGALFLHTEFLLGYSNLPVVLIENMSYFLPENISSKKGIVEKRWFISPKCYQDSFRSLQVTNAYDGRQEGAVRDPLTLGWTLRRRNGLES